MAQRGRGRAGEGEPLTPVVAHPAGLQWRNTIPLLPTLSVRLFFSYAFRHSSNFLVRLLPASLVSWVGGLFLSKVGHMVKIDAQLVPLSSIIEKGEGLAAADAR